MARIRYIGELPSTRWLGATFVRGEWHDAHGYDDETVCRLIGNPTFEVVLDDPASQPLAASQGKPASTPPPAASQGKAGAGKGRGLPSEARSA